MEKTIEQQIAEGVANGIQQAKNTENEMKRKSAKEKGAGYVIFFLTAFFTFSVMVMIQTIGIKYFGMDKHFLHAFAYPLVVVLQLAFTIPFFREDFKTKFASSLFGVLINSFGNGFFISLAF